MQKTNHVLRSETLEHILITESLTPLFQPIVSLKENKIFGYEALIRGPSDSLLHSPLNLFDAASREDRLFDLDILCRKVAITAFVQQQLPGKLFINVIPEVLLQEDYPQGITRKLVTECGLSPSDVVIELTEQYPIGDYPLMREATNHYRQMGFSIAIDDLGAGYSGLRTWSELKPDFVKIDRHFLQDIHSDQNKSQFVSSMIEIAREVNCRVIGEGIEIREEYLCAERLNIEMAQGYYFSRPATHPPHTLDSQLFVKRKTQSNLPRHKSRKDTLVRSLLTECEPVYIHQKVNLIGERFLHDESLAAIPVLNQDKTVAGIIWRTDLLNLYASRYGREIYGKKTASSLMKDNVIVTDVSVPLQSLSQQITQQNVPLQYSTFIITEDNEYRGIGNLIDLLKHITELQISTARHANPLSGLPGNVPISQHTQHLLEHQLDAIACYIDLDNFKPYNDNYGFRKGDQVILATADILQHHVDPTLDFLGHIGGDDFVIFFESPDWREKIQAILHIFTQQRHNFYTQEDIKKQGISATNRQGEKTFFPLLSLSVGAVNIRDFPDIHNEAILADYLTKAKSRAKKLSGNSFYLLERTPISTHFNLPRVAIENPSIDSLRV